MSQSEITLTAEQHKRLAEAIFNIRHASYLIEESLHVFKDSCYGSEEQDDNKPLAGGCLLDIIDNANGVIMLEHLNEIKKILWGDKCRPDNGNNFLPNVRINAVQISAVELDSGNPPNGGRETETNDLA